MNNTKYFNFNSESYIFNFEYEKIGKSIVINADCFKWMEVMPEDSIHSIVTDPPFGVKEYEPDQLEKRKNGNGGVWRIPPSFDGHKRSPLPRFTALNEKEKGKIKNYFSEWAIFAKKILRPGGHVFLASNSFLSQIVFSAIVDQGLEYRGQVVRLVRTMRGGDRPKNEEKKYNDVCTTPRSCYEPWGIFRKPLLKGMKVSDCLSEFQTGGLRRKFDGNPFEDVIESQRTSKKEREISDHPSLKPQSFLLKLVYSSLPLGKGIIVDPFMGSGSTIAAAEALGYSSIGIEREEQYFKMSIGVIRKLLSPVKEDENIDF